MRRSGTLGGACWALAVVLLAGSCGFRPMMAERGDQRSVTAALADVQVGAMVERSGQYLRNRLIDRLYSAGRPSSPHYRLEVIMGSSEEALAVQRDAGASRAQWAVTANYRLVHIATGTVVYTGSSVAYSGYNISNYQYASFASSQDAFTSSLDFLSEDITRRLSLFFARDPDQRPRERIPPQSPPARATTPPP